MTEQHDNLFSRAIDGELTPAERAELDRLLARDPAARARYEQLLADHRRLAVHFAGAGPSAEAVLGKVAGRRLNRRPRIYKLLWPVAAAAIAAAVGLWVVLMPPETRGAPGQIEVKPLSIEVTVFSHSPEQDTTYQPRWGPQAAPMQQRATFSQSETAQVLVNDMAAPWAAPPPGEPDLGGMLLVKDRRLVTNLREGDNLVRYTDVAGTIDPTSVRFTSETDPLGTTVVEQNFEYDLATADAVLKRYVDRRIACIDRQGGITEGYLCSWDADSIVLADRPTNVERTLTPSTLSGGPKGRVGEPERALTPALSQGERGREGGTGGTVRESAIRNPQSAIEALTPALSQRERGSQTQTQTLSRQQLTAIRLPDVPADLQTRPTLVWKLRTQRPGRHETLVTYVARQAVWRADYVALLRPGEAKGPDADDLIDLSGWVTITNQTGSTYRDAGIKLIAGDVHRVRDPWAPVLFQPDHYLWSGDRLKLAYSGREEQRKEFVEKGFFEYHLYTLTAPSTVRDRQVKQLKLLARDGAAARRLFWYDGARMGQRVEVRLECENAKDNQLGLPLPKGVVRFMQRDGAGELHFAGQAEIDHTPKDETLKLTIGTAFDVVGERTQTGTRVPSANTREESFRIRVRNHKAAAIHVRVEETLAAYANWKVLRASDEWTKHDFQTIWFDFELKPDSEKVVTYTVRYDW